MEGKIVFQGKSGKGKKILIRYIQKGDAGKMLDYINTLSKEQTFLRFQGEQLTIEEEERFLDGQLQKLHKNQAVHLLVFSDQELIGTASVTMLDKTDSHVGLFGISLGKGYRGEGIGKLLMKITLKEAEDKMPQLRLVTLYVFGDNILAQGMYKKFGFIEYGRLPEGSYRNGKYSDLISMFKKVR